MNTVFEIVILSDDPENADAAGEAALDEISRIDSLLSRFNPNSETARINHHAHAGPVLVDLEMARILTLCTGFGRQTGGYFDITATDGRSREAASAIGPNYRPESFEFDSEQRLFRFTQPDARLDFGAIGKGYALDKAAGILIANGIENALLHGGTSSILALGHGGDGEAWRVGIRNPFSESLETEIAQIGLINRALSSSSVFGRGDADSDLINPLTGSKLDQPAACAVIAETGAETEALSTAFLSMGRSSAEQFCRLSPGNFRLGWIDQGNCGPNLEWFGESAETICR